MKFYDPQEKRLVYIEKSATAEYWDNQWDVENFKKEVTSVRDRVYVEKFTKKYLQLGVRILEGGCGKGQYVYALKKWGFEPVGLDYAEKTVERINELFPELEVVKGDVRAIPFDDSTFDAYWSFGVIEHFFEGFEQIALEMKRVLKNGGYLFVTFPHMSKIRRLKAYFKKYPIFNEQTTPHNFYQFALNEKKVEKIFENYGFHIQEKYSMDGVKGLKDEVAFLAPLLQKIYTSRHIIFKIVKKIINVITKNFASHSILLIFKLSK